MRFDPQAPYDVLQQDPRDPHWMLGEPSRRNVWGEPPRVVARSTTFPIRVVALGVAIGILLFVAWGILPK